MKELVLMLAGLVLILALFLGISYGLDWARQSESSSAKQERKMPEHPQFVLFSFDGSRNPDVIQETLDFADSMNSRGKPIEYTYFVNAAHFVSDADAAKIGLQSQVRFGGSSEDLTRRIALFKRALGAGDEMASHTVRHNNGQHWSTQEWLHEFSEFDALMSHADTVFGTSTFVGFRAPELGISDALYPAVANAGFRYDTSPVGRSDAWPKKNKYGTWVITLPTIPFGPDGRPVLSMDYSIWMHQSQAKNIAPRGSDIWKHYFNETLDAYRAYFNTNYAGNRAPVLIANHLYTDWNDEVYWEVLKEFAEEVCGKPDVVCSNYRTLVDYMDGREAALDNTAAARGARP